MSECAALGIVFICAVIVAVGVVVWLDRIEDWR